LSFDETFTDNYHYSESYISEHGNKDYENREFLNTLSGLDIKWNKTYDTSHIREVYTSYLYQAAGIISSHIGLAEFSIIETDNNNKETSMGLCSLYEQTGKSLIKRSLKNENKSYINMGTWKEEKSGSYGVDGENYGDLYECGYGYGKGRSKTGADFSLSSIEGEKVGVADEEGNYIPAYERKTSTDIEYDDSQFKNMINIINNGTYDQISQVIDLEEFAIKEAITYFIGNPDGMRYYYNNYMVYFRRTDGKAIIIPKDNDRCLGITRGLNLRNALKDEKLFTPIDRNEKILRNNLFLKTILSNSNNDAKNKYQEAVLAIINSDWAKNSTFKSYFEIAKSTYNNHEFLLEDTHISFSEYVSSKIDAINRSLSSDIRNIYFQNTLNWTNVYCYVFCKEDSESFEIIEPLNVGTLDELPTYHYSLDVNTYTHIIFCNGELGEKNQSEKIEITYLPYISNLFYLNENKLTAENYYQLLLSETEDNLLAKK
jgi:hypothetical protein